MKPKPFKKEVCGVMILTPTPEHNGGAWCANPLPCKTHSVENGFVPTTIKKCCTGLDCPEQRSLCCNAPCTPAKEDCKEGETNWFVCSKCRKPYEGGECTAGDDKTFPVKQDENTGRFIPEEITFCHGCFSMTKTFDKKCGKCKATKIPPQPQPKPKEQKKKICGEYCPSHDGKDIHCSNYVPCLVHEQKKCEECCWSINGNNPHRCTLCCKCDTPSIYGGHGESGGVGQTLPTPTTDWEEDIKELRDEFEELFPKDIEATMGIRPSKSHRSEALVLWAKWNMILTKAVTSEKEKARAETIREIMEVFENIPGHKVIHGGSSKK